MTSTQVKQHIKEATLADKVVAKKDGTYSVQKNYFYRHGNTAEGWGEKVSMRLTSNYQVTETHDHWNAWPKDSYFEAIVIKVS